MKKSELIDLQNHGMQYLVVTQYAHADKQRGDIVAWFKSYSAACLRCSQFDKVMDINDAIFYAAE